MLVFCLLLAVCTVLSVNLRSRVHYEYAFQNFMKEYKRDYNIKEEYEFRLRIFIENLDKIDNHNKVESSWKMGINKFVDLTIEEFRSGYLLGGKLFNDNVSRKEIKPKDTPAEFLDWNKTGAVTPAKDQGSCKSQWAFATIGALEGLNFVENGVLQEFSTQQLLDCSTSYGNKGCKGGSPDNAYRYVIEKGICSEAEYPYVSKDQECRNCNTIFKINNFYPLIPTEYSLLVAVNEAPISVGMFADLLHLYISGIFNFICAGEINHHVLVTGYNIEGAIKYWIVKNSWGPKWGERGFFRIAKDTANVDGLCHIAQQMTQPVIERLK